MKRHIRRGSMKRTPPAKSTASELILSCGNASRTIGARTILYFTEIDDGGHGPILGTVTVRAPVPGGELRRRDSQRSKPSIEGRLRYNCFAPGVFFVVAANNQATLLTCMAIFLPHATLRCKGRRRPNVQRPYSMQDCRPGRWQKSEANRLFKRPHITPPSITSRIERAEQKLVLLGCPQALLCQHRGLARTPCPKRFASRYDLDDGLTARNRGGVSQIIWGSDDVVRQ